MDFDQAIELATRARADGVTVEGLGIHDYASAMQPETWAITVRPQRGDTCVTLTSEGEYMAYLEATLNCLHNEVILSRVDEHYAVAKCFICGMQVPSQADSYANDQLGSTMAFWLVQIRTAMRDEQLRS